MVQPIAIHLAAYEVQAIKNILEDAVFKAASYKKDAKIETIVLAEFFTPWSKRLLACLTATGPKRNKAKLYPIPVSVARILHYRIQQIQYNPINQEILTKLDNALTNCNMKPDYPTILL